MSNRRIPESAGWCNGRNLKKGPNCRNLCRECNTECPANRRTFCSPECVHEWQCRTDPSYQARQVFKRDAGMCVLCGTDTIANQKKAFVMLDLTRKTRNPLDCHELVEFAHTCGFFSKATYRRVTNEPLDICEIGINTRRPWDMDHIVPVVEQGGECGLENLRTLCIPCHRVQTAALNKRLAKKRREDKEAD